MSRKRGSSWFLIALQALGGVPRRQAARSMTLPDDRSPLTSYNLEPPSTAWPPSVPSAPIASSRPRQHALILARHSQSRPTCKEPAIDRYTCGVKISPLPLLKVFESRIIDPQKMLQIVISRSNMHNLITKQRAPRSQKRTGAETTLRTAWVEHPVLPGFCQ